MQTVLAIDDSPDIHTLLDVRLRPEGLDLRHALDPIEGLAMATREPPDLVLLDVDMPGLSGMELCSRLKGEPATSMVPVIFLTGAESVESVVRGFDLGAVDYVKKPFDPAELRARVRAALRTKRFQDMLAVRAQIDGLTGLWNRGYFEQRLRDEVNAVRRYGRALSLVLLDVDHFKNLNDSYGHPFGDLVLQRLGELLTQSCRATDAACRFGGEELALVLTETPTTGGVVLAERLREAIASLGFRPRTTNIQVTASFGVAGVDEFDSRAAVDPHALVARADWALYEAKRAGRNRVCFGERLVTDNA